MADDQEALTQTLSRARGGDEDAAAVLFPLVYGELRRLAGAYLKDRAGVATLQPTALTHEAFLRLIRREVPYADRQHFMAVAATAMRQILIDHARRRGAQKRAGDLQRVTLVGLPAAPERGQHPVDLLALEEVLGRLAALSPRQARVVELLFFAGMTVEEAAAALSVSGSLVEKEWRRARAWVRRELERDDPGAGAP
jgi:RNA polymerase sigma-70 factor, ECF subfamily